MKHQIKKLLESVNLNERKFNWKAYVKNMKLPAKTEKVLMDYLNKHKDGIESSEDIFMAMTDLGIRPDESLNEKSNNLFAHLQQIRSDVDHKDAEDLFKMGMQMQKLFRKIEKKHDISSENKKYFDSLFKSL